MSSSKPETTIFFDDSISEMRSKVKKAHSGGKTNRGKNIGDTGRPI